MDQRCLSCHLSASLHKKYISWKLNVTCFCPEYLLIIDAWLPGLEHLAMNQLQILFKCIDWVFKSSNTKLWLSQSAWVQRNGSSNSWILTNSNNKQFITFSELYFTKSSLSSTHELSEVNFEAFPDSCGIVVVTFVPSMDENPERLPTKDSIYISYKSGRLEVDGASQKTSSL